MQQLKELLRIVGTGEFQDCGRLDVTAAEWRNDELWLHVTVDDGLQGRTRWDLQFAGLLECSLTSVSECGLNISSSKHPAVAQYIQAHGVLAFSAPATNPDETIGALWAAHRKLADDWIPFDRYFNRESELRDLLSSANGVLATGPTFLIKAYAEVLKVAGCRPSRVQLPRSTPTENAIMAHFGESYVVARTVKARLSPPN